MMKICACARRDEQQASVLQSITLTHCVAAYPKPEVTQERSALSSDLPAKHTNAASARACATAKRHRTVLWSGTRPSTARTPAAARRTTRSALLRWIEHARVLKRTKQFMKWNIFLDDPLRWAAQDGTGLTSNAPSFPRRLRAGSRLCDSCVVCAAQRGAAYLDSRHLSEVPHKSANTISLGSLCVRGRFGPALRRPRLRCH